MGIISLTYMRPSYVTNDTARRRSRESFLSEGESVRSGKSARSSGIPDAVSFEKIINGVTCPPLTVRNFMDFLLYKEHAAENLQFYLWHRDYVKRFEDAPASDRALAPEWTQAREDEVAAALQKDAHEHMRKAPAIEKGMFKGTDFEKTPVVEPAVAFDTGNPFTTPPRTATSASDRDSVYPPSTQVSDATTYRSQASEAFTAAGVKTPFTIQPFRQEIDRIVSTYIMVGAPRQLNLSDRDRKLVMHALSDTTHPSALRPAFKAADYTLRVQSHPNFIRWSTCNGCPPRISFARTLGWAGVLGAFLAAILATLSSASRGWRAFAAIGWVLGIQAVVASHRGMCICMYTFSRYRYHIRPWELFVDAEDAEGVAGASLEARKESFDSFGSSNSFEQAPWVVKYKERNLWRKIFDREAPIEEPILRAIHDTIFLQALVVGVLSGAALTVLFVLLPAGNFF